MLTNTLFLYTILAILVIIKIAWCGNLKYMLPGSKHYYPDVTRIYGGFDAVEGSAPYQVALRGTANASDVSNEFCGGSFISPCHVLTAAHCQPICPDNDCYVGYGRNLLTEQKILAIESFNSHENYVLEEDEEGVIISISNDIAIIKLACDNYPEFDGCSADKIDLIDEPVPCNSRYKVTGYGYIDADQNYIDPLQETELLYAMYPDFYADWLYFITAYNVNTGRCLGDSGGPLVYNGKQAGVVSFGTACGDFVSLGGFADVFAYRDWIHRKMVEMPC